MNVLQLLPMGDLDRRRLDRLRAGLLRHFNVKCDVLPPLALPDYAYNAERQQYSSTEILTRMYAHAQGNYWRMLTVTSADLYVPILTFVFGEAELGGRHAVVSTYRLRQEFYGLPNDNDILDERLLKEAVHELGHTLDLTHCRDYYCAMSSSHAVEWIDLKESSLCDICQEKVLTRWATAK